MNLIDVTVNSTTPRRKVRLGSVQELENVVSSIMAENYCFWHGNHHVCFGIIRFTFKVLIVA